MRVSTVFGIVAVLVTMAASAGDLDDGVLFLESKDYARAMSSFRKAAEQGNPEAQSKLGLMYEYGLGEPQDFKQALLWYERAAAAGHAETQNNLGVMFALGRFGSGQRLDVDRDDRKAYFWIRKAAEQGIANAQIWVGIAYRYGRDVPAIPQDYVEAHKWFNLASVNYNAAGRTYREDAVNRNTEARKYREELEKLMTREQIAEAQRRASEWMKVHKWQRGVG